METKLCCVPKLYLVAAQQAFDSVTHWQDRIGAVVEAALDVEGLLLALQIRLLNTSTASSQHQAADILRLIREIDSQSLIPTYLNSRTPGAQELGFDGEHWTSAHLSEFSDKESARPCRGASVHSVQLAQGAGSTRVDFVVAGSVFQSSWKSGHELGLDGLHEISVACPVPVLAIGGIQPEHVAACLAAGASGVAVVSGVFHAADPRVALRSYSEALRHT